MKHPTEDTEDIWKKAIEEWCVINWCEGMENSKTVHDANLHIQKMMDWEFKMRTDPLINGTERKKRLIR